MDAGNPVSRKLLEQLRDRPVPYQPDAALAESEDPWSPPEPVGSPDNVVPLRPPRLRSVE